MMARWSLALLVLGCGASPAAPAPRLDADELAWLEGTWQSEPDPSDGSMLGEEWTLSGGALTGRGLALDGTGARVETERLEILERDGALLYVATPVGQERTEFVITERSEDHFVAENPDHDFPTRIAYRRRDAPLRLEIHVSSAERSFDLVLTRR